jgi:lysophospholipase-3
MGDNTVATVSLSMGGPYFLGFLNQQTQAWKDKYIHSFSSFDGAFGGSASASSALISTAGTDAPCRSGLMSWSSLCVHTLRSH